jgi:hypothetical protein
MGFGWNYRGHKDISDRGGAHQEEKEKIKNPKETQSFKRKTNLRVHYCSR